MSKPEIRESDDNPRQLLATIRKAHYFLSLSHQEGSLQESDERYCKYLRSQVVDLLVKIHNITDWLEKEHE